MELENWLDRTGHVGGYTASAQAMYELSRDWYSNRMDEDWQPPPAEVAEAIFRRHGLTGEFWSLG